MSDSLTDTVATSHALLRGRIDDTTHVAFPRRARDHQCRADAFLICACRHVTAVSSVLVAEVDRRGASQDARLIAHHCHLLQIAMLRAKGRLYGASQLARLPWPAVWDQVVERFDTLVALELGAVAGLATRLSPVELDAVADRMRRVEEQAPTRPHPFLARHRVHGRLPLTVWALSDRIWDSLEGRSASATTPLTPV